MKGRVVVGMRGEGEVGPVAGEGRECVETPGV